MSPQEGGLPEISIIVEKMTHIGETCCGWLPEAAIMLTAPKCGWAAVFGDKAVGPLAAGLCTFPTSGCLRALALRWVGPLTGCAVPETPHWPVFSLLDDPCGHAGSTRFEDANRLPLGIPVNPASFCAKTLVMVGAGARDILLWLCQDIPLCLVAGCSRTFVGGILRKDSGHFKELVAKFRLNLFHLVPPR